MTKAVRNRLTGLVKNSNDEASVLNAGWSAMQQADPNLAGAVQRMPPEVARGVVFQYTNAIRSNQDDKASELATQFAREQLALYAQNNPQSSNPVRPARKVLGRSSGMQPPQIGNTDALDSFMANPTPFQNQQSQTATTSIPRPSMFAKSFKSLAAAKQPPAPKDPREAFDQVRNQYQAFNQANWGEYEKNLLWDKPPERELTKPANWSIPSMDDDTQQSGLVANQMRGMYNNFWGN